MGSLGFTAPALLWGAAAALAVLIIHLLKRPKTEHLTFSTLRFFTEAAVSSRRSRTLRKVLLLLVRMLLIALIALIFAGPYNKNDALRLLNDSTHPLYIAVDPTPSMDYREKDGSPAEHARMLLERISTLRKNRGGTALYSPQSRAFIPYRQFDDDQTAAPVGIFDLPAFGAACEKVIGQTPEAAFIIISDFQGKTAAKIDKLFSGPRFENALVATVPFIPQHPWNCFINDVAATTGAVPFVTIHLANTAPVAVQGELQVTIGELRMVPVSCRLGAGTDTVITLETPALTADAGGTVRFTSGDPMPFDDLRYFAAGENATSSILIIGPAEQTWPVAAAIRSYEPTARKRSVSRCTNDQLSISTLTAADVLIVCGGDNAESTIDYINRTPAAAKQTIIVACDSAGSRTPQRWKAVEKPLSLTLSDTVSELWRGFPSLTAPEVHIYRYRTGLSGPVLAYLSNGLPFATAAPSADGRLVITLATPLDISSANNLCETSLYVPLLDRLLYRAESFRARSPAPWIAGRTVKNLWAGAPQPVPVLDADGKQLLQLQNQPFFTIEKPGIYRVVPSNASANSMIAIIDPQESETVYQPPKSGPSPRRVALSAEELAARCSGKEGIPWQIAPWIAVVLLLVAELLLRERPSGDKSKRG